MFLVLFAAAIGIASSLVLAQGSMIRLRRGLRLPAILAIGAVALLAAEWLPLPGRPGILIVATILLAVGLSRNAAINGTVLIGLGLCITALAVLVNGYLPIRGDAIGGTTAERAEAENGLRTLEDDSTRLGILGDVVPVGPLVVSFGDLIAAAGAFIAGRKLFTRDDSIHVDDFLAEFERIEEPTIDLTAPPTADRPSPPGPRIPQPSAEPDARAPKLAGSAPRVSRSETRAPHRSEPRLDRREPRPSGNPQRSVWDEPRDGLSGR